MPVWVNFIALITPAILGVLFFVAALLLHKVKGEAEASFSVLGFTVGKIPVSNLWVIKGSIFLVTIILFSSYIFRDYGALLPSQFDMDVYYDDEGIVSSLREYNEHELATLRISKDWGILKQNFLREIDLNIEQKIGAGKGIFSKNQEKGWVHSSGYTTTDVQLTKEWQMYFLKEISGHLVHRLEQPDSSPIEFRSEFSLMDTEHNYVQASICDIYLNHDKVIRPVFRQALSSPEHDIFQFVVIGVTKISSFPIPRIGRTLYCVQSKLGELVPIGYAIYRPR
jgi:hypothetical protein